MKKTQRKDAWENIRKQKVSFLSIVVISAMAVMAYLGLNFASRAIADNADRFYENTGFRDAEVVSTLLLTPEDLDALRETEGVTDGEALWQTSGTLLKDGEKKNVNVLSLTERVNTPLLQSGRLPETMGECLVDAEIAAELGLSAGDEIRLEDARYLNEETFTVCGIVLSGDYATKTTSAPGNRNVTVLPEAFDREALEGCFMKALLRFGDCEGENRFNGTYLSVEGDTLERVKALSEPRAEARTAEVREIYGREIASGEEKLTEAETELKDARRQLDEGWAEYRENEAMLAEGGEQLELAKAELEDARRQLAEGQTQLADGLTRLEEAEAELADALAQLSEGQTELDDAERQLADGRRQLDGGWGEYRENEALLADAERQLEEGKAQLEDGEKQLEEAEAQLEDARRQLDEGWVELQENEALLPDAQRQLEEGRSQLEDGEKQLEEAEAQLAEGRQQLDEGWTEYREKETLLMEAKEQLEDGERQYEDGERQLRDAEDALSNGASSLISGQSRLADSYAQIEDGKEQVRSALRSSLVYALGETMAELISWTPANGGITVDSAEAKATVFPVTEDITLDLNQSLAGNIAGILNLLLNRGVTEEELRSAVSAVYGAVTLLPEESFVSAAARSLAETYASYNDQYEQLAAGARAWDEGHQQYLDGKAAFEEGVQSYTYGLDRLNAARKELDEGWEQYLEGKALLTEGLETLERGEEEYAAGLEEFLAAKEKLEDGWAEYNDKLKQYNDGAALLAEGREKLEQGEKDYALGLGELEDGRTRLSNGWAEFAEKLEQYNSGAAQLAEGRKTLEQMEGEYARGRDAFLSAQAELEAGWEEYRSGLAQYEEGRAEYGEKSGEYDAGLEAYNEGLVLYEEKRREYEDGQAALAEGLKTLEQGEADYAQGEAEYLEGVQTLEDARRTLETLDECRWVILDMRGNASYQIVNSGVKNVADMGMTFALIFILVGALVIYATLGRIVEEQRRLVGATKALGLYRREVLAKYLCFGVGATAIGVIIGVALGYFCIQPILTSGYGQFYTFDYSQKAFLPGMTLTVLAGGLLLSAAAVYIACAELLRTSATGLMQEKAPSAKQRGGRWMRRLPLYTRMILLNVITDKKRVAVTVVSVAGCCALLVAGLTMRGGIMEALDRQFSRVARYDYCAVFSEEDAASVLSEAREDLEAAGAKSAAVLTGNQLFSVGGELNAAVLLCGDLEEMQAYFARLDPASSAALPAEPEGVWIRSKAAEVYGLRPGDTLTLYDGNMKPCSAVIAGVYENYVGRELVMSRESYRRIFGAEPEDNALLILNGGAEEEQLRGILAAHGAEHLDSRVEKLAEYRSLASVLDMIALLMIGIAGIMACFILLNLVSMHVNQKKKELTIMRVNGFTVREVIAYIARETVVTNLLGILVGLGAGAFLGYRTICLMEGNASHFVHSVQPLALAGGVVITAGFSVILNAIALRKVKHLKLTDVA